MQIMYLLNLLYQMRVVTFHWLKIDNINILLIITATPRITYLLLIAYNEKNSNLIFVTKNCQDWNFISCRQQKHNIHYYSNMLKRCCLKASCDNPTGRAALSPQQAIILYVGTQTNIITVTHYVVALIVSSSSLKT